MAEYNPITDVYTEVIDAELREEFTFIKDVKLQEKTATANGIILPDAGKDGLSKVTVNVPNSYTAEDEGKVVSEGALVAQGSQTITQNGTYDTTLIDVLIANIEGGGSDDPFALKNYIQSSGTQWVDTNYIPTLNTHIEVVAKVPSNTGVVNCLLGVRDVASGQPNAKAVIIYAGSTGSNKNTLYCQFSGSQNSFPDVMASFFDEKAVYQLKRGKYLIRDDQWGANGGSFTTDSSVTSTRSIYLFALHNVDGVGTPCPCSLYRIRFYEGDTLAMELLPWIDDNDVVCFKDTLTGNLKYNSGTGNLVYGTDA